MKRFNFMRTIAMIMVLAFASTLFTGCGIRSKVVPPGTVVIVLQADGDSEIYTQGSYTSWGRDRVYFVDTKLKSFGESLKILCTDEINMEVDVKWVGSFKIAQQNIKTIKEKVPAVKVSSGDLEGYQLSLNQFYKTALRDIIRANTRTVVSKYSTDQIRDARETIRAEIAKRVTERITKLGYPVTTTDLMVSNLDYPEEITNQRKAIKNAQLEDEKQEALAIAAIKQAERNAGIAREDGKAEIERARADAAANKIRSDSLTPQIIQMRQWDVLAKLAGKMGEGDVIIVPYTALGDFTNTQMLKSAISKK